jgi:hypothetical protein
MGEVLDFKGKLTSGILCLYVLKQGTMLYSESASEDGENYLFDAAKTGVIVVVQNQNGRTGYHVTKGTEQLGHPSRLIVPKASVAMVQDVTDENILKNVRATLAGLILAK